MGIAERDVVIAPWRGAFHKIRPNGLLRLLQVFTGNYICDGAIIINVRIGGNIPGIAATALRISVESSRF